MAGGPLSIDCLYRGPPIPFEGAPLITNEIPVSCITSNPLKGAPPSLSTLHKGGPQGPSLSSTSFQLTLCDYVGPAFTRDRCSNLGALFLPLPHAGGPPKCKGAP